MGLEIKNESQKHLTNCCLDIKDSSERKLYHTDSHKLKLSFHPYLQTLATNFHAIENQWFKLISNQHFATYPLLKSARVFQTTNQLKARIFPSTEKHPSIKSQTIENESTKSIEKNQVTSAKGSSMQKLYRKSIHPVLGQSGAHPYLRTLAKKLHNIENQSFKLFPNQLTVVYPLFAKTLQAANRLKDQILPSKEQPPFKKPQALEDKSNKNIEKSQETLTEGLSMEKLVRGTSNPILGASVDLLFAVSSGKTLANTIEKSPNSSSLTALGLYNASSVISAAGTIYSAQEKRQKAIDSQNHAEKCLSEVSILQGASAGGLGAVSATNTALSLAYSNTTNKTALTGMNVLGYIGRSFSMLSALTSGIPATYTLTKGLVLKYRLSQSNNIQSVINKYINLDDSSLPKKADSSLSNEFDTLFTNEEKKEIAEKSPNILENQQEKARWVALRKNQWASLERALGSKGIECIKNQGIENLSKTDLEKHLNTHLFKQLALVSLSVICLTAGIIASITTGGVFPLVVGILWLVASLGYLSMDILSLYHALHDSKDDLAHQVILVLSGLLMTCTLVAATFFSAGIVPLVGAGIIAGLYLASIAYERWLQSHHDHLLNDEVLAQTAS